MLQTDFAREKLNPVRPLFVILSVGGGDLLLFMDLLGFKVGLVVPGLWSADTHTHIPPRPTHTFKHTHTHTYIFPSNQNRTTPTPPPPQQQRNTHTHTHIPLKPTEPPQHHHHNNKPTKKGALGPAAADQLPAPLPRGRHAGKRARFVCMCVVKYKHARMYTTPNDIPCIAVTDHTTQTTYTKTNKTQQDLFEKSTLSLPAI